MNKLSQLWIGPELLWVFFYLVIILLIKVTFTPVKSIVFSPPLPPKGGTWLVTPHNAE